MIVAGAGRAPKFRSADSAEIIEKCTLLSPEIDKAFTIADINPKHLWNCYKNYYKGGYKKGGKKARVRFIFLFFIFIIKILSAMSCMYSLMVRP
jgi:hypothetical protein